MKIFSLSFNLGSFICHMNISNLSQSQAKRLGNPNDEPIASIEKNPQGSINYYSPENGCKREGDGIEHQDPLPRLIGSSLFRIEEINHDPVSDF